MRFVVVFCSELFVLCVVVNCLLYGACYVVLVLGVFFSWLFALVWYDVLGVVCWCVLVVVCVCWLLLFVVCGLLCIVV